MARAYIQMKYNRQSFLSNLEEQYHCKEIFCNRHLVNMIFVQVIYNLMCWNFKICKNKIIKNNSYAISPGTTTKTIWGDTIVNINWKYAIVSRHWNCYFISSTYDCFICWSCLQIEYDCRRRRSSWWNGWRCWCAS